MRTTPVVTQRELAVLFVVAVAVRLLFAAALGSPERAASGDPWIWGQETACMAQSLVDGEAYGDPWGQGTGPSAWLTPAYPLFLAGCIWLAGGISEGAAWLAYTGHALVSSLCCLLLVLAGSRLGAARAGRMAGWAFAILPASLWMASSTIWDTTFSGTALLGLLTLLLAPRPSAIAAGLVFGLMGLLSPALWGILPAVVLRLLGMEGTPGAGAGQRARRLLLFAAGALLVSGPWMVRNSLVLGTAGLRSNLGVELRVGNNDAAYGRHEVSYHPSHSPRELERYRQLGEVRYSQESRDEALAWIREKPQRFLGLTLERLRLFWFGEAPAFDRRVDETVGAFGLVRGWIKWGAHMALGFLGLAGALLLRRGKGVGTLLRWSVLLYPLPYYLTHVAERYRFPIEPVLLLLACCLLTRELRPRPAEQSLAGSSPGQVPPTAPSAAPPGSSTV